MCIYSLAAELRLYLLEYAVARIMRTDAHARLWPRGVRRLAAAAAATTAAAAAAAVART